MAVRHKKADLEPLEQAAELVFYRARGGMIETMTGVSKTLVKTLYSKLHNDTPPGGPLPLSISSWLDRDVELQNHRTVQVYLNLLHREMGDRIYDDINVNAFLNAYRAYRAIEPEELQASISHLFVAVRDVVNQVDVDLSPCPKCHKFFVVTPKVWRQCEICRSSELMLSGRTRKEEA